MKTYEEMYVSVSFTPWPLYIHPVKGLPLPIG